MLSSIDTVWMQLLDETVKRLHVIASVQAALAGQGPLDVVVQLDLFLPGQRRDVLSGLAHDRRDTRVRIEEIDGGVALEIEHLVEGEPEEV